MKTFALILFFGCAGLLIISATVQILYAVFWYKQIRSINFDLIWSFRHYSLRSLASTSSCSASLAWCCHLDSRFEPAQNGVVLQGSEETLVQQCQGAALVRRYSANPVLCAAAPHWHANDWCRRSLFYLPNGGCFQLSVWALLSKRALHLIGTWFRRSYRCSRLISECGRSLRNPRTIAAISPKIVA